LHYQEEKKFLLLGVVLLVKHIIGVSFNVHFPF